MSATGYVVNRKNSDGKFEKVTKLFANSDGSFSNKKDGYALKLNGKYPDFEINGNRYGKTFLNESKASGNKYYLVKNSEEGDLFLFEDKPRTTSKPVGNGQKSYAKRA